MIGVRSDLSSEFASSNVARAVWGLLLIWVGAALLLRWSWGVDLLGAGAILLAAQAFRRASGLKVDAFGLVAGLVVAVCGAGNLLGVAIEIVPLLFIVFGVVILVSAWTAHGRDHAVRAGPDVHAQSRPGA